MSARILIETGASAHGRTEKVETSLYIAITKLIPSMVVLLINKYYRLTNINILQDSTIKIILYLYLEIQYSDMTTIKEKSIVSILNLTIKNGMSNSKERISKYYRLCAVIFLNNILSADLVIDQLEDFDFEEDNLPTLLEFAIKYELCLLVEKLLSREADLELLENNNSTFFFVAAIQRKNLDIIDLLIHFGIDVNAESKYQHPGITVELSPLIIAARLFDQEFRFQLACRLLANGANVLGYDNEFSMFSESALYIASFNNNLKLVKLLLIHHAHENNEDQEKATPLYRAVNHTETARNMI